MYVGIKVNYTLILLDFNETQISSKSIDKSSNFTFRENASSRRRVVRCGETDKTKLTVAFSNFAKAPKNFESLGCK
jgi:hypothetical protein